MCNCSKTSEVSSEAPDIHNIKVLSINQYCCYSF